MGRDGVTRRTALSAGLATAALTATGALTGCANVNQDDRPSTDQPAASGTVLTSLNALPVGGIVAVTIDRRPAFVVRPPKNSIGAFSAICTHQGCTSVDDVSDEEVIAGIALLARTEGIFAETAGGVTVAVLWKLLAPGALDPAAETVIFNTGDGLKTLGAIAHTVGPSTTIAPNLAAFDAVQLS